MIFLNFYFHTAESRYKIRISLQLKNTKLEMMIIISISIDSFIPISLSTNDPVKSLANLSLQTAGILFLK